VTIAVSLLTGLPLLAAGWRAPSEFVLGLVSVLGACVPAWSMIVGAVGASPQRKTIYACGLLLFAAAFDVLAFSTGWQAAAMNATVINGASGGFAVGGYQLLLLACPVVTLILFAGKRPAVFWESAAD